MNQTVFGTEMVLLTFVFSVLQILVLFVYLGYLIANPKTSRRFLLLILLFFFYNLASGLLPDDKISIDLFFQNVLAFGSGILLACYYFYFLVKELEIQQRRFFSVKFLVITLIKNKWRKISTLYKHRAFLKDNVPLFAIKSVPIT